MTKVMRKTARELELSNEDYEALISVRNKLANGTLSYFRAADEVAFADGSRGAISDFKDNHGIDLHTRNKLFNMNTAFVKVECTSVGCIGGWMGREKGMTDPKEVEDFVCEHNTLHDLFYPEVPSWMWSNLEARDAVRAIDHYLLTGDALSAWQNLEDEIANR